jgi:hypothetical protein
VASGDGRYREVIAGLILRHVIKRADDEAGGRPGRLVRAVNVHGIEVPMYIHTETCFL